MNRGRHTVLAVIATAACAAAVPLTVGASQQATATPKQHTVKLLALKFSPGTIAAKQGDTVRFVWVTGIHNIVASSGPSKLDTGKPVENHKPVRITLKKKGSYRFLCEPHQFAGMVLTIRVK